LCCNWDDELIAEWLKPRNEYAVLSTYVHHIDRLPINHLHDDVPYICKTKWGEGHMIRNEQASSCVRLPRPKLTFTWGAGLSFSKCHAMHRVPYDPNLPQIFDGEEFSIAMRLFTNGYDVYTPGRNLVFHDYTPVPRHWSAEDVSIAAQYAEKQKSWLRLRTLFKMPEASGEELGEYGLGSCRSYESFVEFSGVDPRIGKASLGEQCGNMIRVPWNGDCWPPVTLPPFVDVATRAPQPAKGRRQSRTQCTDRGRGRPTTRSSSTTTRRSPPSPAMSAPPSDAPPTPESCDSDSKCSTTCFWAR
jgi:hypothetical protein